MELIKSLYFAVFFFSIIVIVDLLFKFKRPLLLKLCFAFLIIPSVLVLYFTGYFNNDFTNPTVLRSLAASSVLGVIGTSMATILFYYLVKQSGMLFGSMVTYGIPVVAVAWGLLDGESLSGIQIGCLGLILFGVWIVNRGHLRFTKKEVS